MENTRKTILVVDDDPYIVDLVTRQLKAKGFAVLQTTDPETAYSLAEKEKPDLIISDVAMPALDGFSLFKGLKNNKITCNIPLVLLTGSDKIADIEHGFVSGAKAYLLKPFDWNTAWPKLAPLLGM
jgi:DNA-binding response OmpR family regulator